MCQNTKGEDDVVLDLMELLNTSINDSDRLWDHAPTGYVFAIDSSLDGRAIEDL